MGRFRFVARPMPKKPRDFTIIDMVCDPGWLGDTDISVPQIAVLKAINGLAMTREEADALLDMTAGRRPANWNNAQRRGDPYFEATLCVGVRAGKGDKIGANQMTWQAIQYDAATSGLAPGEIPYIGIIAQNSEGAAQNRGYLEGKALLLEDKGWDILDHRTAQERAVTGLQIRYKTGAIAQIFPAKRASVRNKTMIGGLADELAWWETEEVKVNADVEICRALRQRMTTTRRFAKFLKMSSPHMEHGELFSDFEKRAIAQRLFVHAPSWVFNPTLLSDSEKRKQLREAERDDPEGYLRDFGAQFGKAGGAFYAADEIDRAMRVDRPLVMQPREGVEYKAWIDAAFRRDLFAVCVAHRSGDEIVYDLVHWWTPPKGKALDPKEIVAELAAMVKPYRIDRLGCDAVADVPLQSDMVKHDIRLEVQKMSTEENNAMHRNYKAAMRRGLVSLPKDEMIRRDVLACVKNGNGNKYRIEAPQIKGFHDDITKVCAAVALELMPIGSVVDIAELNRGAVPDSGRHGRMDWTPVREDAFEHDIMGAVL